MNDQPQNATRSERSQETPSGALKWYDLLASGFYSGKLPGPSGTWGTAAALAIYYLALQIFPALAQEAVIACLAVLCAVLGIYCSEQVLRAGIYGESKDPGKIVIDEFAGFYVSIMSSGGQLRFLLISFLLFRLFDITKPYPARKMESLRGGYGVMLDDIVAGFYALIAARLLQTLLL